MAVRIRSLLVSRPVMVPLVSGSTVRLSPGQLSDELHDVEVTDNAKIAKLRDLGAIDVEDVTEPEAENKPRSRSRARGGARPGGKEPSGKEPSDKEEE
ncbi:hypothetical protein ABZ907_38890 [Nonomuraea wenchangensis]